MSTRCNIVVKSGKSVIHLYRHYDGYLAETGADIYTKLGVHKTPSAFLRAMMAETYEKEAHEPAPRPVYDLTTDLHGDIEHVYYVTFAHRFTTGAVSVKHAERPKGWAEESLEVEDWTRNAKRYDMDAFRKIVNEDRAAINVRLEQMKVKSEPYAMLGVL
jgi:hypothetical protein